MAQSSYSRESPYPKVIRVPRNIQEVDTRGLPPDIDPFEYYRHMMQHQPQNFQSNGGNSPQLLDSYPAAHLTNNSDIDRVRQPIEHSTIQSPEHRQQQQNDHSANHIDRLTSDLDNMSFGQNRKISQDSSHYNQQYENDDVSFEFGHSIDTTSSSIASSMSDIHRSDSCSRTSYTEEEDIGLQHSLSGIQKPVPVRSSSNSSQGSCDSMLSFVTVGYESAVGAKNIRTHEANRIQNGRTASTQPYDESQKKAVGTNQYQGGGGHWRIPSTGTSSSAGTSTNVRMINHNQGKRQELNTSSPQIFISYAQEPSMPDFRRLVLQLAKTLLNNGIGVSLDMLERNHMSMSFNTWLDEKLLQSTFVVVCISPNYKNEIIAPDLHRQDSIHTKYIFTRLQTEYIQNGSLNYRVIPVLLAGATQADVPNLWQDTHAYQWPGEYEHIIYRIFQKEMYVKPKMGPAPICTVITNGDNDAPNHHRGSVSSAGSAK